MRQLTGGPLRQSLAARIKRMSSSFWVLTGSFFWLVVSVGLLVVNPLVSIGAACAPVAAYILATRSWARVAVVVGGGVLVLGSSSDVGPLKILYAGAFILCAAISSVRLLLMPPTWFTPFRSVIVLGFSILACLLMSTIANPDVDLMTTVRQGIFYIMIPFAPIIGIDAGRDASSRNAMRWIGVIGCIAAVGFAADWLNRRGVSSLPIGRFIVSSLMLPALAFALAAVRAVYARGVARILWLMPIILIPAAMLVTGTRSVLIVFLALIGVLGTEARRRVTLPRMAGLVAISVVTVGVILPLVGSLVISQPGFLENRVQALQVVLDGNGGADGSYAARNEQYYYAAQWISQGPWFGKGPGFSPPISLDTPLAVVVRIGIVGAVALTLFLASVVVASRKSAQLHGYTFMHTTVTGIGIVILASLPFGAIVEDKGFSFMLLLLTMGLAAYIQERVSGVPDLPVGRRQSELAATDSFPESMQRSR
jgi:hypothetical protein